jgi:hypothetical protein
MRRWRAYVGSLVLVAEAFYTPKYSLIDGFSKLGKRHGVDKPFQGTIAAKDPTRSGHVWDAREGEAHLLPFAIKPPASGSA